MWAFSLQVEVVRHQVLEVGHLVLRGAWVKAPRAAALLLQCCSCFVEVDYGGVGWAPARTECLERARRFDFAAAATDTRVVPLLPFVLVAAVEITD